jgi:hypothetical protein
MCDALFFNRLLLPYVYPALSGTCEDTHLGFYEEAARNTNLYAFGVKNRRGTRGHLFVLLMLRSSSSGMGLCVGISITILLNHGWWVNQTLWIVRFLRQRTAGVGLTSKPAWSWMSFSQRRKEVRMDKIQHKSTDLCGMLWHTIWIRSLRGGARFDCGQNYLT